VTVGVALVLVGWSAGWIFVAVVGALLVMGGLATLAVSLAATVRRSLLRRFDLSARFYVLALVAGTIGVGLGGLMVSGIAGAWYSRIRMTHLHLNLIGLVGFTIIGTLPTLLPTIAHHRAVSGYEARWGWWVAVASTSALVVGVVGGEPAVGLGAVLAGVSLVVVLAGVVGRLGRRGLVGRLPYVQVVAGCLWLAAWMVVDGGKLLWGASPEPFQGWTMAAVTAGIGQVLAGSLAYLVPVLVGPGPLLARNFDRTHRRALLPLLAANGVGTSLVLGSPPRRRCAAGCGCSTLDFGWPAWSDRSVTVPTMVNLDRAPAANRSGRRNVLHGGGSSCQRRVCQGIRPRQLSLRLFRCGRRASSVPDRQGRGCCGRG
jgi:nitrite reductase (NO-forming)